MNLNSQVEQNVAHWILFLAFCLSLAASFYSLIEIQNLEEISAYTQSGLLSDGF
jgi:hypothetical protein